MINQSYLAFFSKHPKVPEKCDNFQKKKLKRVLYACPFLTRTNVNSNAAEEDKIEITIEC